MSRPAIFLVFVYALCVHLGMGAPLVAQSEPIRLPPPSPAESDQVHNDLVHARIRQGRTMDAPKWEEVYPSIPIESACADEGRLDAPTISRQSEGYLPLQTLGNPILTTQLVSGTTSSVAADLQFNGSCPTHQLPPTSSHYCHKVEPSSSCVKCEACDWRVSGVCVDILPESLLFSPSLANPSEPRLSYKRTSLDNNPSRNVQEATVGGAFGVLRLNPYDESSDGFQLDVFAVVLNRFSDTELLAINYRFGFPLTFRCGPWSGKVGWEHKCTHLGDGLFAVSNISPVSINRDDIVIALSRDFDSGLRLYGVYGIAIGVPLSNVPIVMNKPNRFGCGIEWSRRQRTGPAGQPFGALDLEFRQTQNCTANMTTHIGWQWRNRSMRSVRIALEAHTGRSPFGQFYLDREKWLGVGTFLDF